MTRSKVKPPPGARKAKLPGFVSPQLAATTQSSSKRFDYELVDSIERLSAIHDELITKYPEHVVLYRGQTRLYPKLQSGRRRPGTEVNADVEQGWSVVAGRIIAEDGRAQKQMHLRKAVLQHYGFVTDYLDLTSDIQIAAWFATNEFESHTTFLGWRTTSQVYAG